MKTRLMIASLLVALLLSIAIAQADFQAEPGWGAWVDYYESKGAETEEKGNLLRITKDGKGLAHISIQIPPNSNHKNQYKYTKDTVFMVPINSEDDWESLLTFLPVAIWRGNGDGEEGDEEWCNMVFADTEARKARGDFPYTPKCAYPLIAYYVEGENYDLDGPLRFLEQYKAKRVIHVDEPSGKLTELLRGYELVQTEPKQVFDFWLEGQRKEVVYVKKDYALAMLAAQYAAYANAPLVIEGNPLPKGYEGVVTCIGAKPAAASCEIMSAQDVRNQILSQTGSDKALLANPNDIKSEYCDRNILFLTKRAGQVRNLYCRDSLMAAYLAAAKEELIVQTNLAPSHGMGSRPVPLKPDNVFSEVKESVKRAFGNLDVPRYFTYIASPLALQFAVDNEGPKPKLSPGACDKNSVDFLLTEMLTMDLDKPLDLVARRGREDYAVKPYGRVMGTTVSDTSALVLRSVFSHRLEVNDPGALFGVLAGKETSLLAYEEDLIDWLGKNNLRAFCYVVPDENRRGKKSFEKIACEARLDEAKIRSSVESMRVLYAFVHGNPKSWQAPLSFLVSSSMWDLNQLIVFADSCLNLEFYETVTHDRGYLGRGAFHKPAPGFGFLRGGGMMYLGAVASAGLTDAADSMYCPIMYLLNGYPVGKSITLPLTGKECERWHRETVSRELDYRGEWIYTTWNLNLDHHQSYYTLLGDPTYKPLFPQSGGAATIKASKQVYYTKPNRDGYNILTEDSQSRLMQDIKGRGSEPALQKLAEDVPELNALAISDSAVKGTFTIPEGLANLRSLDLRNTQVTEIRVLGSLPGLRDLSMPSTLKGFTIAKGLAISKLTRLNLRQTKLTSFEALSDLPEMKYLDLPKSTEQVVIRGSVPSMTSLSLSDTAVTKLEVIGDKVNLEDLYLPNSLTELTIEGKRYAGVKTLGLYGTKLQKIRLGGDFQQLGTLSLPPSLTEATIVGRYPLLGRASLFSTGELNFKHTKVTKVMISEDILKTLKAIRVKKGVQVVNEEGKEIISQKIIKE